VLNAVKNSFFLQMCCISDAIKMTHLFCTITYIHKMNDIRILKTIEMRTSRTLDILLISYNKKQKILFLYNYEGIHYRLFDNKIEVRKFFNCEESIFLDFDCDEILDSYLLYCQI
jgi:hypothetical protein